MTHRASSLDCTLVLYLPRGIFHAATGGDASALLGGGAIRG
jgi:hypothetical protein